MLQYYDPKHLTNTRIPNTLIFLIPLVSTPTTYCQPTPAVTLMTGGLEYLTSRWRHGQRGTGEISALPPACYTLWILYCCSSRFSLRPQRFVRHGVRIFHQCTVRDVAWNKANRTDDAPHVSRLTRLGRHIAAEEIVAWGESSGANVNSRRTDSGRTRPRRGSETLLLDAACGPYH